MNEAAACNELSVRSEQRDKKEKDSMSLGRRVLCVSILTIFSLVVNLDRYITAGLLRDLQVYFKVSRTSLGWLPVGYMSAYLSGTPFSAIACMASECWERPGLHWWRSLAASIVPRELFWLFLILRSIPAFSYSVSFAVVPALISGYFKEEAARRFAPMFFSLAAHCSGISVAIGAHFQEANKFHWALCIAPITLLLILTVLWLVLPDAPPTAEESENKSLLDETAVVSRCKTFWLATLGISASNYYLSAQNFWFSKFTSYAMASTKNAENVSFSAAVMLQGVAATVGNFVGSIAVRTCSEKWRTGCRPFWPIRTVYAPLLMLSLATLLWLPVKFAYLQVINFDIAVAITAIFIGSIFSASCSSITSDIIRAVIPSRCRAFAIVANNVMMVVSGDALAPAVTGWLFDCFKEGEEDSAYAMFSSMKNALQIAAVVSGSSFAFSLLVSRFFEEDIRIVETENVSASNAEENTK